MTMDTLQVLSPLSGWSATLDDNPDEVEVRISEGGSSGINYGYIIEVSDHGILDPEVRVVSSRMLMLNVEIEQANAVLEEAMGFGVDELIDKQAEYKELAKRAK